MWSTNDDRNINELLEQEQGGRNTKTVALGRAKLESGSSYKQI